MWVGYYQLVDSIDYETDAFGNKTVASTTDVSDATVALLIVGAVVSLVFNIYNLVVRQGRTGYSLGKTIVGIKLVKISTGQPMGAGLCFVRWLQRPFSRMGRHADRVFGGAPRLLGHRRATLHPLLRQLLRN